MNKQTINQADLHEIKSEHLAAVSQFLHNNMNSEFSPQEWERGIGKSWLVDAPNAGYMLMHDDVIVGVLCAIYSEQYVEGKLERFCNPHTWCVLPDYRSKSVDLVLAVIRQPGFHFTMFSPNKDGIVIFQYLKFKPLDNSITVLPSIPSLSYFGGCKITCEASKSLDLLPVEAVKYYRDHMDYPWLNFVTFGDNGSYGFFIFKVEKYKKLPCARIMYVSDTRLFQKNWPALRTYLLFKHGIVTNKIESRLLEATPIESFLKPEAGGQKFYLSNSLSPKDIQNVYSELVTLDLR